MNDIKFGERKKINSFFYELFYVLTGAVLIFVGLEIFWPGLVVKSRDKTFTPGVDEHNLYSRAVFFDWRSAFIFSPWLESNT